VQLRATLETKWIKIFIMPARLTASGYEEAAGQGLLAGINASLRSYKEQLVPLW
jgi:tRNA U34 5-carboxymethylaminomethyl modifying enzyme MnmG/GidA